MTPVDICQTNDISMAAAENALANLQERKLVTGYTPGDYQAEISPSACAAKYMSEKDAR
jgi:hypothetical protein